MTQNINQEPVETALDPDTWTVKPLPGEHIGHFATRLSRFADEQGRSQLGVMNQVGIEARPGQTPDELVTQFFDAQAQPPRPRQ